MSKELEKEFMNDIMNEVELTIESEDTVMLLYDIYDVPYSICEQIKNMVQRLEAIDNKSSSTTIKSEPLTWYDIKFAPMSQSMKVKHGNNIYMMYYQDYGEFEHLYLQDITFGTNVFTASSNEPTQVEAFNNLKLEEIE